MKKTVVYEWIKQFTEGREQVTDEERIERPVKNRRDKNIVKIYQIMCTNQQLTMRSRTDHVDIDRENVQKILTEDLNMYKVYAKMIAKLTNKQKKLYAVQPPAELHIIFFNI